MGSDITYCCSSVSLLWSPKSTSVHPLESRTHLSLLILDVSKLVLFNQLGRIIVLAQGYGSGVLQLYKHCNNNSDSEEGLSCKAVGQHWRNCHLDKEPQSKKPHLSASTSGLHSQKDKSWDPDLWDKAKYGGKNWHRSLLLPPLCWLIKWIMIKLGSLMKQEHDAREKNGKHFGRESVAPF